MGHVASFADLFATGKTKTTSIAGNPVMNAPGQFDRCCPFREVIQEDESGSITSTINAINQKNRRKELAQLPNVRLGMVRLPSVSLNTASFPPDASSLSRFGLVRCHERSRSATQPTLLCHRSKPILSTFARSSCSF